MRCVRSPAHLSPRMRAYKLAFTPQIVIDTNSPAHAESSPHVRGTLETLAQLVFERGIIPACARDTCRVAGSPACRGDHLRMCGEHGAVVVELDCSKIPRDQLSRLEHQSGGYLRVFYFSWI